MDKLSHDQLEYFEELYNAICKDSENITYKELDAVLNALGGQPTEGQCQEMINEADTDGNGSLELFEFTDILCRKLMRSDNQDDLREAYYIFDKDRNGFISSAELRSIYITLGIKVSDEDVDEMIREADLDNDGVITMDEFMSMMTTNS